MLNFRGVPQRDVLYFWGITFEELHNSPVGRCLENFWQRPGDAQQLEEWNVQIALLKARAAKAEAKIEYYKTIEALQHKQDEARTKLPELKTTGNEAWENLKPGTAKAWDEVKIAFRRAAAKFKMVQKEPELMKSGR